MRSAILVAAIAASACSHSGAALSASAPPSPAPTLAGDWIVDLSVDPAEPYTKPMTLVLGEDGSVSGSFY